LRRDEPAVLGAARLRRAGQLGLEETPVEYIGEMVEIFREVRRVLRSDGTAWVNMGEPSRCRTMAGGYGRTSSGHKPNPMPESVRDRCTKAHEYLFLLAKSERYYYDAEAIKEPASENTHARYKMPDGWDTGPGGHGSYHRNGREKGQVKIAAAGSGIKANDSMAPQSMG
jgi:hypothetical protein